MQDSEFVYEINANDEIRAFSGAWLECTSRNGGSYLLKDNIVGRSVWDFIPGGPTRHLYELLFKTIRINKKRLMSRSAVIGQSVIVTWL